MDWLTEIKKHCSFDGDVFRKKTLHGGDINEVYVIEADNQSLVVKQNNALQFPKMMEKEFRALEHLQSKSPLNYPSVRSCFEIEDQQFLVMEYSEQGENSSVGQSLLGKGLAGQHKLSNLQFGWREDNYIGSLPQANCFTEDWNIFFAEQRIMPQTKRAFDTGLLEKADRQRIERLCNLFSEIFTVEPPALLHGDLWGGNYFIANDGFPLLYDPAIYFGHREMDIAMTRLFGGFSSDFYRAYQEEYPLFGGWENRLPFFQLYPNLVHLNLFGEQYLPIIQSVIQPF